MRAFVHSCSCVREKGKYGVREVRENTEVFCTGVNLALQQVFGESGVFKDSVLRGVVKV